MENCAPASYLIHDLRRLRGQFGLHRVRWPVALALSTACILLSACSATRIGYNMAPTLLDWRISGYVTFTAAQQEVVDRNLATLHEWHRKTQLPLYVGFLDKLTARLSTDNSRPGAPELAGWRHQAVDALAAVPPVAAPLVAEIVLTLEPAQLDQIEARMSEDDTEARKRYQLDADPKQRFEARLERWTRRAEWFLGELSTRQRVHLEERVRQAPDSTGWWQRRSELRQRSQAVVRAIATDKPTLADATRQIELLLASYGAPTSLSNPAQVRVVSNSPMLKHGDETMAQMLSMASSVQIAHLRAKLGGLSEDLSRVDGFAQ
ncbi:MAG: DUF6279 family lipoprotein [Burkholderiaceae bacterium]